jgi:hypothetical protein
MKKGDRLLCPLPDALDLKHNGGRGQSGLSPFSAPPLLAGLADSSAAARLNFEVRAPRCPFANKGR